MDRDAGQNHKSSRYLHHHHVAMKAAPSLQVNDAPSTDFAAHKKKTTKFCL